LRAAKLTQQRGAPLDPLRQWSVALQGRTNYNKAACALANKLARICYASLRDQQPYEPVRLNKKMTRESFALPA